jgi:hypothetical protein
MPLTRQAILHHPITRLVIGLALTLGIGLSAMFGTQSLLSHTALPQSDKDPIAGTVFAFLVCTIYILLYRWYEKRAVTELSTRNLARYLAGGYFGPQGSTQAAVLCLLTGIIFLQLSRKHNLIVPPPFKKRR